ncbi:hypothetical protein ES703_74435 [subsurface metagenome]
MKIPIFMIFTFIGVISRWAEKALADGKVTALEGLELVVALAGVLGVQTEFNVSDYITPPSPEDDILIPLVPDESSEPPETLAGPNTFKSPIT